LGDRTKQNRPTRRFASLPETAEYLGVSTKTVRRRVADGTFTAYRCGPRLTRLDLNEVDERLAPIPTMQRDAS
jgi:excisionase family DNA binding protein